MSGSWTVHSFKEVDINPNCNPFYAIWAQVILGMSEEVQGFKRRRQQKEDAHRYKQLKRRPYTKFFLDFPTERPQADLTTNTIAFLRTLSR